MVLPWVVPHLATTRAPLAGKLTGLPKTARVVDEGHPACAKFTAIRDWQPMGSQGMNMVRNACPAAILVSAFCCILQEMEELGIVACSANAHADAHLTSSQVVSLMFTLDVPNWRRLTQQTGKRRRVTALID